MALQGELFPDPEVVITPDGARREPLVWVSRLVIWEKPGGEILREVSLRRGLNVIWSPDPGADQAALGQDAGSGHGAGKTLFCRLLRYCLGEDSFSNDEQRRSIAQQLPAGLVGTEVIIAGKTWSVIRPIGMTRKHFAREGISLEAISPIKDPGESIQPLLDSLERLFSHRGLRSFYLSNIRMPRGYLRLPGLRGTRSADLLTSSTGVIGVQTPGPLRSIPPKINF